MPRTPYDLTRSYSLLERARKVVPRGVYGTRSVEFAVPGKYPQFLREGRGSRVRDVDGNEYVDLMGAFGPNLLGYRHPAVEAAVREQAGRGNALTFPTELWVELAETLVARIDVADWVAFGKNGSDVTDYAIRLARQHTGRRAVLVAEGAYHTFHPWGVPIPTGVPDAWRAHIERFTWGDADSLEAAFRRSSGDVAGVLVTPFRHEAFHDQALPTPEWVAALHALCDRHGALMLLDDVRAAFRCHASGLSHHAFGYRPDAICYGKAISNGQPVAVIAAREALRGAASQLYFSATHFFSAEPMAAALATLRAFDEEKAFDAMNRAGEAVCAGLRERAAAAGFGVRVTGPPTMPFLRFDSDPEFRLSRSWCGEMAQRGVLVHPYHNWFMNGSLTPEDVALVLDVAAECFGLLRADAGA